MDCGLWTMDCGLVAAHPVGQAVLRKRPLESPPRGVIGVPRQGVAPQDESTEAVAQRQRIAAYTPSPVRNSPLKSVVHASLIRVIGARRRGRGRGAIRGVGVARMHSARLEQVARRRAARPVRLGIPPRCHDQELLGAPPGMAPTHERPTGRPVRDRSPVDWPCGRRDRLCRPAATAPLIPVEPTCSRFFDSTW